MTTQQEARRQKRILRLLVTEHCCPPGGTSMSHYELVKALDPSLTVPRYMSF